MTPQNKTTGLINLFSHHYRKKYGKAVGKIALSTWQPCPNRANNGGCIYCSAAGYTPYYLCEGDSISDQIKKGKKHLASHKFQYFFAYFQQETTTALPLEELKPILLNAIKPPGCIGLIISTRPDSITTSLLDFLASLSSAIDKKIEILLELGLQSCHEKTLTLLNRNHSFTDYRTASILIKQYPQINQGVHLIIGLPGENKKQIFQTVKQVCKLGVDAIKFHHLQILKNTKLHEIYQNKPFHVYQAEEYLELLAELLALVPQTTIIHRLWSSTDRNILVVPRWQIPRKDLAGRLKAIMSQNNLFQGKHSQAPIINITD